MGRKRVAWGRIKEYGGERGGIVVPNSHERRVCVPADTHLLVRTSRDIFSCGGSARRGVFCEGERIRCGLAAEGGIDRTPRGGGPSFWCVRIRAAEGFFRRRLL